MKFTDREILIFRVVFVTVAIAVCGCAWVGSGVLAYHVALYFGVDDLAAFRIAFIAAIFGVPLALLASYALFVMSRAIMRESLRAVRRRLSTWTGEGKRLGGGPYR